MCKKKDTSNYIVVDMDTPFVTSVPDYETYALFNMKNAGHEIDRYVKISSADSKKSIYRKSSGRNGVLSTQVALAHKTQKELSVQSNSPVTIKKASFWGYYWYNSEKYLKWTFRVGVIGFFLTVFSSIIAIVTFLKDIACLGLCG